VTRASRSPRAVCVHGHYYQPPREDPWLGVVEPEPSAAPDRDWNTRITRECYAPCAAARILDARSRLRAVLNVCEWTSFDFGPTLLAWLAPHAPEVVAALRRADTAARRRTGHGSAWAQPYAHPILPLSSPADVRTQVLWGRRDFEHRFGRPPEGMWLPEMAVDRSSLEALADAGIALTLLAPHQARRVRPLGAGDDAWRTVTPATLDTRRLYRCVLPGGRAVDVLFRDAALSQEIAFGGLVRDGAALAARLHEAVATSEGPAIVGVAVDGETFGHHHAFAEMALAFALETLAARDDVALLGPAAYRALVPPTDEVEIVENTSWSCPHGVERWRADCGCRVGTEPGTSQAWRAPLRAAIDWLRDEVAVLYEAAAGEVLRDPWGARDRYVDCVLEPARLDVFLAAEAATPLSASAAVHARRALELARHALLMQTSCGWFFDDVAGLEAGLVLRQAARAIELALALGRRLEEGFVSRLEPARSNLAGQGTGADIYRRLARSGATPGRVAASAALLVALGEPGSVPGYAVELPAAVAPDGTPREVQVTEHATGATTTVTLAVARDGNGLPVCRAGDAEYTLADLFGVQRERLLGELARMVTARVRAALAEVRPLLEPLLAAQTPCPVPLADLLGWEEAEAMAETLALGPPQWPALAARAAAARRRGLVLPAGRLVTELTRALASRLAALPGGVEDVLCLLDVADAAGLQLDLAPAQVLLLGWWTAAPAAARDDRRLARLAERLGVAAT
jgi:alpha-amylase/alpha-mannosidase (GH57 family)